MNPSKEEILKMWDDPKNYKWGCFYACKDDPRLILPKKGYKVGWTINFAHPQAFKELFKSFLIAGGPGSAVCLLGTYLQWNIDLVVVLMILAVLGSIFYLIKMGQKSDQEYAYLYE